MLSSCSETLHVVQSVLVCGWCQSPVKDWAPFKVCLAPDHHPSVRCPSGHRVAGYLPPSQDGMNHPSYSERKGLILGHISMSTPGWRRAETGGKRCLASLHHAQASRNQGGSREPESALLLALPSPDSPSLAPLGIRATEIRQIS